MNDQTVVAARRWSRWWHVLLVVALVATGGVLQGRQPARATSGGPPVVGWGYNSYGEATPPAGLSGVTAIATGYRFSLALKADGTVVGWGSNDYGAASPPAGLNGVTAIAAGYDHSLALKADGTVVGWGHNEFGQATSPVGLSEVTAIASAYQFSLALKADGTVVGWGSNNNGQATPPAGLSGVTGVGATYDHSLALKADGTVVGWGSNGYGEATPPAGLNGVTAIAAGDFSSLALKADGTVVGWGYNGYGEATPPAGLNGVTAIAAGGFHSLALKADHTVVGWGSNDAGQATPPAGLSGVTAIAAGQIHSLALKGRQATVLTVDGAGGPYGGTATLSATLTSGGNAVSGKSVAFTVNGTSVGGATTDSTGTATSTNVSLASLDVGDYPVTAQFAGDADNDASDGAATLTVSAADQSISFGTLPSNTFGDAAFNVTATASSLLGVTFAATGDCTVNGTLVSITAAGSCTITASQPGNGNYHAAPDVPQSFSITQADQTISFGAIDDHTYGDTALTLVASATSTLAVGFSVETGDACSLSGASLELTGAGSCQVTASQPGDSNFNAAPDVIQSFSIAKATQTITFDALDDKTFGDAPFTVQAASTSDLEVSFVVGATDSCTISGNTVTIAGAGSCTLTASQPGTDSFDPAAPASQTFTIDKADQTITFSALVDKTVGDGPFSVSATAGSNEPVAFTVETGSDCTVDGTTVTITGAGTCTVVASQTGDANYKPAPPVSQTFAIATANQTITFGAVANKTYGVAPFLVSATATSHLDVAFTVGVHDKCTIAGATVTITGAGSCTVTASQPGDDSYNAAASIARTFSIATKPLRMAADNVASQYSDPLPALTVTPAGFAGTDTLASLSGTLTCTTTPVVSRFSPAGTYAIGCGGLTSPNYTISWPTGTLTITPEDAAVRLAPNNPHAAQVTRSGMAPDLTFIARITEANDGSYGKVADLAASPVSLNLAPISGTGGGSCTAKVTKSMAATATTPAYVDVSCIVKGGVPVNVYQVTMSVAGKYYAGSSSDVLTVFDPTQGGATGGGTITRANGSIGAFAFAATRLKSNQVQGKMLYIETGAAGNQTVLKGNAMSTMTISGNTASVTGKATLNGTGNFSYVLSVTDANTNQPSSATDPDMYGQRVTDPGGAPVAGLSVDKTVVTSGNVFVGK